MYNHILKILAALILGPVFTSCATTGGVDYAAEAAQGIDVFAGKNWNAPRRNNMYDRWEFNAGGTFHFWHIHHGEALDRGVYHYEAKDGIITIANEGEDVHSRYSYVFIGKTVTLTPYHHGEKHETEEHGVSGHGSVEYAETEHAPSGEHQMGALPEAAVTFTHAR
jgi:hypothetical protein